MFLSMIDVLYSRENSISCICCLRYDTFPPTQSFPQKTKNPKSKSDAPISVRNYIKWSKEFWNSVGGREHIFMFIVFCFLRYDTYLSTPPIISSKN